jgi:hypothetical protein
MHVLKNVSKSWTTDQFYVCNLCARWLDHSFTQVGTHFRNSSPRRPALARNETAAGDDLMANRMPVHEVDTITKARRKLAAELRDLADRLDGQEPDYSALHDAWEVLVELGDQVESLRIPSRKLGCLKSGPGSTRNSS